MIPIFIKETYELIMNNPFFLGGENNLPKEYKN